MSLVAIITLITRPISNSAVLQGSSAASTDNALGRRLAAAPASSKQAPACTAVPGETTAACHSSCQVCKDTPGTPASTRECVCCKAAGWVPSVDDTAACTPCPRSWTAQQGDLQCTRCQPGFSTLQRGSTVCDACAAGYEGPNCTACDPGSYSARGPATAAAVGCVPCPLGSSSSKSGSTFADCKTADGQGIVSMQVNATLLGTCNASLASALLPVVEDVVAKLAGSGSGVLSSVTAGSCSTRIRPARRRSAPAVTTERTASYMFDVLATSAAGLTEDALQFALLKELVGLRLPGWGRLLVTSLGVLDLGSRDALNLDCSGDPEPSLLPNANWECSPTTPHRGSCLAAGCLPGFTASAALLYAQCAFGQWKWDEAFGRCWPDCTGNPRGMRHAFWNCSITPVGGLCNATACKPGFEFRGPIQARCQPRGWNVISGACKPFPCYGLPSDGSDGISWAGCNASAPIKHNTLCNGTCPALGAAAPANVSARCSFGKWNVTGACGQVPPACYGLPSGGGDGVSWAGCNASAPIKHNTVCNGTCPALGAAAPATVSARCSFGQWNVTGKCEQATPALPCPTPPNKAPGVSWDCSAAAAITSGDHCVGSCVQAAGAQVAKCSNGSFTITGSCTPLTFITCPYPPSSQPGYVWNQCSSGAAGVGQLCVGACAAGYAASDAITAICQANAAHAVTGVCIPLPCPNPPSTGADVSWPCSVGNTSSGTTCRGSCNRGYAGGVAATCTNGNWLVGGTCQGPASCINPPNSLPGFTWASSCASAGTAAVGSTCTGGCQSPGYTASQPISAKCNDRGQYDVTGQCIGNPCSNPPNRAAGYVWPIQCNTGTASSGDTCTGTCANRYTASGTISALCSGGQYLVTGSCNPPGNQAPTAVSDTYSITVLPDTAYPLSPDVKQNDFDPDGDPLTVGLTAPPLTTLGATVTISGGQMLYTMPAAAYAALGLGQRSDSFTYMVADGKGGTAVGSVTVQLNRPPTAVNVASAPQARDTITNIPVVASSSDADNDILQLVSVGSLGPGEGAASVVGNSILWTPSLGNSLVAMSGSIVIPFTLSDGRGGTATAKLTIPLTPLPGDPAFVIGGRTLGNFMVSSLGPSLEQYFSVTYNGAGNEKWKQQVSGTAVNQMTGTALLDSQGSTISVGEIVGTVNNPDSTGTYTSKGGGGYDLFVRKVDAQGGHVYTQIWGSSITDAYRDAVISGGYLYVLAVTLGNMPREGLSGSSGTFTNQQDPANNMPFDIYLAKINLSDGSRVWSYQFGCPGQDEPRGKKMLHVDEGFGHIYVVVTNANNHTVITAVKVQQPTSTTPASHTTQDVDFSPLKTVKIGGQFPTVLVYGVALNIDPVSRYGGLWITGEARVQPQCPTAAGGCPGGYSDGFIVRVSAGMTLDFIQLVGTSGTDAILDADMLASDTESIYVCGKWAFDPNNPTPFVAKYTVSGSGLVEAWKKEAVTSATFLLEALCRVDAATNQVHVASSYSSSAGNNVLVQAYASADGSLNWPLSPAPFTVPVGQTLATSLLASSDPGLRTPQ
uniref:Laminin EGF-like domain-containing protein n=1 Tax=Tetradesmus obliquus TaxID=3088 RepID=A0A383WMD0_TETOB|eukprot:jgi/Sobl393_1/1601/SZX78561.1